MYRNDLRSFWGYSSAKIIINSAVSALGRLIHIIPHDTITIVHAGRQMPGTMGRSIGAGVNHSHQQEPKSDPHSHQQEPKSDPFAEYSAPNLASEPKTTTRHVHSPLALLLGPGDY
jgi:hypothetical protein